MDLKKVFGDIDIYLFDQLLKGRFTNCQTILDAGCGFGRNLPYFLQSGATVFGIDQQAEAIASVKELSQTLAPQNPIENFITGTLEELPFAEASFDLVICSAVLHFARNEGHFDAMLRSLWRVIKKEGFLFVRTASSIGIENLITPLGNGRYQLPDGSDRFLVTEETLLNYTTDLNATLIEPIKTTNVQHLRCMTTWCVQKNEY